MTLLGGGGGGGGGGCKSPAMRRCWGGRTKYHTVGASVDNSVHRLWLQQHPGPHLSQTSMSRWTRALPGSGNIVHTNGQPGLCASHFGRHHQLLRPLCWMRWTRPMALTLTAGLRINAANIAMRDRSGSAAELNGNAWLWPCQSAGRPDLGRRFGGLTASSAVVPRPIAAPTPLELDCAKARRCSACWKATGRRSAAGPGRGHTYTAGLRRRAAAGRRQAGLERKPVPHRQRQ